MIWEYANRLGCAGCRRFHSRIRRYSRFLVKSMLEALLSSRTTVCNMLGYSTAVSLLFHSIKQNRTHSMWNLIRHWTLVLRWKIISFAKIPPSTWMKMHSVLLVIPRTCYSKHIVERLQFNRNYLHKINDKSGACRFQNQHETSIYLYMFGEHHLLLQSEHRSICQSILHLIFSIWMLQHSTKYQSGTHNNNNNSNWNIKFRKLLPIAGPCTFRAALGALLLLLCPTTSSIHKSQMHERRQRSPLHGKRDRIQE